MDQRRFLRKIFGSFQTESVEWIATRSTLKWIQTAQKRWNYCLQHLFVWLATELRYCEKVHEEKFWCWCSWCRWRLELRCWLEIRNNKGDYQAKSLDKLLWRNVRCQNTQKAYRLIIVVSLISMIFMLLVVNSYVDIIILSSSALSSTPSQAQTATTLSSQLFASSLAGEPWDLHRTFLLRFHLQKYYLFPSLSCSQAPYYSWSSVPWTFPLPSMNFCSPWWKVGNSQLPPNWAKYQEFANQLCFSWFETTAQRPSNRNQAQTEQYASYDNRYTMQIFLQLCSIQLKDLRDLSSISFVQYMPMIIHKFAESFLKILIYNYLLKSRYDLIELEVLRRWGHIFIK